MTSERIGPYKILQTLGEGGMGVVYEAEQLEPVRRRVALKVIRLGMDTKQIVARFEIERQALAVMDHPNIARVLDAGVTEDGRPYFVMELVKGTPLTEYCDTHKLGTRERLDLFTHVCGAVQHAHQKGVIHRDLKPSNVLITSPDGTPVPKVIDFGIAKAVGYELTDRTLITQLGQMIGTPDYMSPEQAEMSGLDVDTRTDIYSLGVMLYELLVGTVPLNFGGVAIAAIHTALRETDPPTPSSRLTTLPGDTQHAVAKYRHTDPASLKRELKGDLDWVVMKCLEKDRTRRYETASGLAAELVRYLRDEPVLARPPSAAYRMKKWVRRHRAGAAATLVALLAIVGGATAALTGMLRAQRAEILTAREAATARQVSDFLIDLFEVSDPSEARGNEVRAREILDVGAEKIRSELGDQPAVQTRLMRTMAIVYQKLGLYGEADDLLATALRRARETQRAERAGLESLLVDLAVLRVDQARYPEAESLYLEALELRRRTHGDEDLGLATIYSNLGSLYRRLGRSDESEEALERALAVREASLGPEHADVARTLNSIGIFLRSEGRFAEAESVLHRALAIKRSVLEPDHPDVANGLDNLAVVFAIQGRLDEAQPLFEGALEIRERIFEPDHPRVAGSINNLAVLNKDRGRYAEAEALFRRSASLMEARLGDSHPNLANSLDGLAETLAHLQRADEAEALYRRVLSIRERALGREHSAVAGTLEDLATLLRDSGRAEEAAPLQARARAIREAAS
ncbi:MAG: serine/threonine-protein kinase [Gemmatimonadetes bacterium]|nr:serine/threonine-protein kinase [Gemmatimonadota bacterium]